MITMALRVMRDRGAMKFVHIKHHDFWVRGVVEKNAKHYTLLIIL